MIAPVFVRDVTKEINRLLASQRNPPRNRVDARNNQIDGDEMHVTRRSVLSWHAVGEKRRFDVIARNRGGQFANPNGVIYLNRSLCPDTASLQSIGVSKVAGISVDDPAMPRLRTMARYFRGHFLHQDRRLPGMRCTTGPTAPLPGAAC